MEAVERGGMRPGMEAGGIQRLASLEGTGARNPTPKTQDSKPSLILRLRTIASSGTLV